MVSQGCSQDCGDTCYVIAMATLSVVSENVLYFANKYHLFCFALPPKGGMQHCGMQGLSC